MPAFLPAIGDAAGAPDTWHALFRHRDAGSAIDTAGT